MNELSYSCLSCGNNMDHVARRGALKIACCPSCGLYIGHTTQKLTKSSDEAVTTNPNHFSMIIDNYTALTNVNKYLLERRLPRYRVLLGHTPRNWIEIGPGSGAFGDAVTQSGAFWLGVEIDKNMAAHMRSQGKNVIHSDFSTCKPDYLMPDHVKNMGGFDIIHFTQVFEHVVKPNEFLRNAFALLRPGGLIHIDVPHHNGLTGLIRKINIFGDGYGEINPPHHMISYGKNTLRTILESAGFLVDDVFSCANNDYIFGLAHAHLIQTKKLRIVWSASRMLGLGGNLVALAHKPL
jgi:SAM-dependent methyltransferase